MKVGRFLPAFFKWEKIVGERYGLALIAEVDAHKVELVSEVDANRRKVAHKFTELANKVAYKNAK